MGASKDEFDKDYWERHWQDGDRGAMATGRANPYLAAELGDLDPGTALDAGCGAGAEAIWLAEHGWAVTAADISAAALARAKERGGQAAVTWIEADLSVWEPDERFDLVLVNRVFDRDSSDGLALIGAIKTDPELTGVPVMLITNYEQHQRRAVEAGALPGFGKAELSAPETIERLAAILGP